MGKILWSNAKGKRSVLKRSARSKGKVEYAYINVNNKCTTYLRSAKGQIWQFLAKKRNGKLRHKKLNSEILVLYSEKAPWKVSWFAEISILLRLNCSVHLATLHKAKFGQLFHLWNVQTFIFYPKTNLFCLIVVWFSQ